MARQRTRTSLRARSRSAAGFRTCAAILFACGLSACVRGENVNDRSNPETPLWYHRASGAMQVVVDRKLTAESRKVGEDYERGKAEIDPLHGRVFCGSADHGLYAMRAGDGSTLWRFETLSYVQSEPYYDGELDMVYFGSHDGALYAVHAFDGSLAWRFFTGAEVARRPARNGDMLYVMNASDQLYAIDRKTGALKWQAHRTPALGMEIAGYAGAAFAFGKVYTAYSDGHVIAYDARTGDERWTPVDLTADAEQNSGGVAPRYLDVDTTPIPDDLNGTGVVYVASYAAGVYALDAETGARVWSNDKATGVTELTLWKEPAHKPNPKGPDKDGPMVPERKILLASSGPTGLWALDPATGRKLWRDPVPEGGITAPVPFAGAILVGTTRYGLFLMSPRNGRVIDGIDLGSGFAQTPAADGLRAYAVTNYGTFVGVQVAPPLL